MPYPSPPWRLHGQLWLSLFPVPTRGPDDRPPGLYGAAFVDYGEGSALSYQELLLARLVRVGGVPRLTITDIWVNSPASRTGGRATWAIPKDLASLHVDDARLPVGARTACAASHNGSAIAAARFTSGPAVSLRTPLWFSVTQRRDDGEEVVAQVRGSARTLPALGTWDFGADGPLHWLHGRRPVASLRLTDFRLTFGA